MQPEDPARRNPATTTPSVTATSAREPATCTRRTAIMRLAIGGLAAYGSPSLHAQTEKDDAVTFFVMSDPQIHLDNLRKVIQPYNVVLILHVHEHAFAQYEWQGYPVFMCPSPQIDRNPNTPDVASTAKGFLVVRLQGAELQLAHHGADGWLETWSRPITLGTKKPPDAKRVKPL